MILSEFVILKSSGLYLQYIDPCFQVLKSEIAKAIRANTILVAGMFLGKSKTGIPEPPRKISRL
jgi:hypothetical protein